MLIDHLKYLSSVWIYSLQDILKILVLCLRSLLSQLKWSYTHHVFTSSCLKSQLYLGLCFCFPCNLHAKVIFHNHTNPHNYTHNFFYDLRIWSHIHSSNHLKITTINLKTNSRYNIHDSSLIKKYLRIMNKTMARPNIWWQFTSTRQLQALNNSL